MSQEGWTRSPRVHGWGFEGPSTPEIVFTFCAYAYFFLGIGSMFPVTNTAHPRHPTHQPLKGSLTLDGQVSANVL